MAQPIPTVVPHRLAAGTTWQWTRRYSDVPTGATVRFFFFGATSFAVDAAEVNGEWAVDVDEAATQARVAGHYKWRAEAIVAGGDRWVLETGRCEVLAFADTLMGTDQRSFNEKMLAALETQLLAGATSGTVSVQHYSVGTREITYTSRQELERHVNTYRLRVRMERNGGRLPPIEVGFVRA